MKVGIIDYGLGNLKSVYAAFQASQSTPVVSKIPKELKSTDKLVLPGVGAFGDAMKRLKNQGLDELIEEQAIELKKPILGMTRYKGIENSVNLNLNFEFQQIFLKFQLLILIQ